MEKSVFIIFQTENSFSNTVDPDQASHYVVSDLGLHRLLMNGLCSFIVNQSFVELY